MRPPLASSMACSRSSRARSRIGGRLALGQAQLQQGADELLLRAVVQVALELRARGVRGLDDAPPRDAQLGHPRLGDVALAGRLLGAALLLDVGEGRHRTEAVGQLERRRRVGDAHDRAVLAHEPVVGVLSVSPPAGRTSGQSSSGNGEPSGYL